MNRIVREHYPVADLPEDLRAGLPSDAQARVVVEIETANRAPEKMPFTFEELYALAKPSFSSPEEVADYFRSMRDEWD